MDPSQRLKGTTIGERRKMDFDVGCQRATGDMRPIRAHLLGGHLTPSLYHLQRCPCRKPLFELDGTVQLEERFPAWTSLKVIQRWRQVTAEEVRANRTHITGGTLAADVEVHLATLADRRTLQALRRVHPAWWVSRFPNRCRHTL